MRLLTNVIDQADWVIVGRFGRPHGVKGLVTIRSFTEPEDNLLGYHPWHVLRNGEWHPITILRTDVYNKQIVAAIEGCHDRDVAAQFTNLDIGVQKKQLPVLEVGEYYWNQLIGMKVINQHGIELGYINEIMPTGSNDVLLVDGDRPHAIPYRPGEYILSVDLSLNTMTVAWDEDF